MMDLYSKNQNLHDLHIKSCGDPKKYTVSTEIMIQENDIHWFPLRLSYASLALLERTKALLDKETTVEATYVPMSFIKVSDTKMDFSPQIVNILFIRTALKSLKAIKANKALYEPLRFIMHTVYDVKYNHSTEVLYIPDKQMNDFIRVTSEANDQVIFLDNLEYACRPSQNVQIIDGPFAGVCGRIKRIKGNICVVIPIEQTAAVAVLNIPRKHLRYLSDQEYNDNKTK
jgi:hypothetical protein